jgi:hypothetical protein
MQCKLLACPLGGNIDGALHVDDAVKTGKSGRFPVGGELHHAPAFLAAMVYIFCRFLAAGGQAFFPFGIAAVVDFAHLVGIAACRLKVGEFGLEAGNYLHIFLGSPCLDGSTAPCGVDDADRHTELVGKLAGVEIGACREAGHGARCAFHPASAVNSTVSNGTVDIFLCT